MNLGQAVAICLYEIARGSGSARPAGNKKVATAGDVERIAVVMLEALEGSSYSRPGASRAAEEKLRRMVRRLELSPNDAADCVEVEERRQEEVLKIRLQAV